MSWRKNLTSCSTPTAAHIGFGKVLCFPNFLLYMHGEDVSVLRPPLYPRDAIETFNFSQPPTFIDQNNLVSGFSSTRFLTIRMAFPGGEAPSGQIESWFVHSNEDFRNASVACLSYHYCSCPTHINVCSAPRMPKNNGNMRPIHPHGQALLVVCNGSFERGFADGRSDTKCDSVVTLV